MTNQAPYPPPSSPVKDIALASEEPSGFGGWPRSLLMYLGKAVAFTVVFWTVWLYVLQPTFYGEPSKAAHSSQASDAQLRARYEERMSEAEKALRRQNELLDR